MKELSFERRIQLLSLAAGLPGSLIALILLWTGDFSSRTAWTLTIFLVLFWLGFALANASWRVPPKGFLGFRRPIWGSRLVWKVSRSERSRRIFQEGRGGGRCAAVPSGRADCPITCLC